jgi:signal transduction histidine kinase
MIIFSLIFIIIVSILSIFQYNYVADDQMERFTSEISNTNLFLNHSVSIMFEGLKLYDSRYDYEMEKALLALSDSYVLAGGNISRLNLTEFNDEFSPFFKGDLDLYLINSSNVVEATTFPTDLGLNFNKIPSFARTLDKIREGNEFRADQWVDSINEPGYYRKYAYLPTPDHRYILEIGLHSSEFSEIRKSALSYEKLGSRIREINPNLVAIDFFNKNVNLIDEISRRPTDAASVIRYISLDELNSTIRQVFKKKQTVTEERGPFVIEHQYFSARNDLTPSASEMNVAAVVVFSREKLDQSLQEYLIIHIVITFLALIFAVVFAMYISRYISRPLEQIIIDIEQISHGDYRHQIRKTGGSDIDRLGSSVELMVRKILADIENIQKINLELASELDRRKAAENALIIANSKLNNLSSITRHDILNQVTSIRGYAFIAGQSLDLDEIHQYMERIQRQARIIDEMIAFSRDYQKIGMHESSWQNLDRVIHDGIHVPFGEKVLMSLDNTGVDILADPMLQKVFYNLADNSLKHGGPGGEKIHISFREEQDQGLLVYEDEGRGIPDE